MKALGLIDFGDTKGGLFNMKDFTRGADGETWRLKDKSFINSRQAQNDEDYVPKKN